MEVQTAGLIDEDFKNFAINLSQERLIIKWSQTTYLFKRLFIISFRPITLLL